MSSLRHPLGMIPHIHETPSLRRSIWNFEPYVCGQNIGSRRGISSNAKKMATGKALQILEALPEKGPFIVCSAVYQFIMTIVQARLQVVGEVRQSIDLNVTRARDRLAVPRLMRRRLCRNAGPVQNFVGSASRVGTIRLATHPDVHKRTITAPTPLLHHSTWPDSAFLCYRCDRDPLRP
jgi:hypothetical protein